MKIYDNLNYAKKRKGKKIVIAVICILIIILAFIFYVGITVGSTDGKDNISDVIRENTELKLKVNELNEEIVKLQAEIDLLNGELEVRPTPEPSPSASPLPTASVSPSPSPSASSTPTSSPQSPISPRIGVR